MHLPQAPGPAGAWVSRPLLSCFMVRGGSEKSQEGDSSPCANSVLIVGKLTPTVLFPEFM